jgi:hypothetical protein
MREDEDGLTKRESKPSMDWARPVPGDGLEWRRFDATEV